MKRQSLAGLRVLLTRPRGQADRLQRLLAMRGAQSLHLPALAIRSFRPGESGTSGIRRRVLAIDSCQGVILVSANAARGLLEWLAHCWPTPPRGPAFYAVGPATAAVFAGAGFNPLTPASDYSTQGLLALPQLAEVRGHRLLIVRGVGGRERLRIELENRGALVNYLQLYRREQPVADAREVHRMLAIAQVAQVGSLEALNNLIKMAGTTPIRDLPLIAPSARIARGAAQLGWRRVWLARDARAESCVAALEEHLDELGTPA